MIPHDTRIRDTLLREIDGLLNRKAITIRHYAALVWIRQRILERQRPILDRRQAKIQHLVE